MVLLQACFAAGEVYYIPLAVLVKYRLVMLCMLVNIKANNLLLIVPVDIVGSNGVAHQYFGYIIKLQRTVYELLAGAGLKKVAAVPKR